MKKVWKFACLIGLVFILGACGVNKEVKPTSKEAISAYNEKINFYNQKIDYLNSVLASDQINENMIKTFPNIDENTIDFKGKKAKAFNAAMNSKSDMKNFTKKQKEQLKKGADINKDVNNFYTKLNEQAMLIKMRTAGLTNEPLNDDVQKMFETLKSKYQGNIKKLTPIENVEKA